MPFVLWALWLRRPPTVVTALPLQSTGYGSEGSSGHGSRAHLLHGMWDLPRTGLEPVSLALVAPAGFLIHFLISVLCCEVVPAGFLIPYVMWAFSVDPDGILISFEYGPILVSLFLLGSSSPLCEVVPAGFLIPFVVRVLWCEVVPAAFLIPCVMWAFVMWTLWYEVFPAWFLIPFVEVMRNGAGTTSHQRVNIIKEMWSPAGTISHQNPTLQRG
ncbi:not available [Pontoporia blainvillei]|uniref:Not available n=1 Tax=Pontoporia blainvillei TaxID=48723 RepID=A0ABX0S0C4_PONBL|nr:not available [Pontoporia blainvillei]